MPITEDDAAEVARSAGLTLTDALALATLARDREHAVALAEQFSPTDAVDDLVDQVRNGGRTIR